MMQIKENWFRLPNEWTDITHGITSLAEFKVVEYIMCHTWGLSKYGPPPPITLDEIQHGRKKSDGSRMDRGTGLDESAVIDGVQRGVADGFLIARKTDVRLRMRDAEKTEGNDE